MALAGEGTTVRVYAIGGDGTVFDCLNGIAGLPNAELALVPYGTGSDFLRSFGGKELVPLMRNIVEQIKAPVIPADIIDCGNIYALNSCMAGLEAQAVLRAYPALKTLRKFRRRSLALTKAIFRIASTMAVFDKDAMEQCCRIRMDDEEIEGAMPLIHIANSPGYPVYESVIPEAVPDDGLLDMVVYRRSSPLKTLRFIFCCLKGQHKKFPGVSVYRQVRSVSISSGRPLCISLDGEIFFDTSFNIRVVPQAIRIVSVGGRSFKNRRQDHAD
jgi:diacylglycerol kinase family enzyme